jgi:hypothetical protein
MGNEKDILWSGLRKFRDEQCLSQEYIASRALKSQF